MGAAYSTYIGWDRLFNARPVNQSYPILYREASRTRRVEDGVDSGGRMVKILYVNIACRTDQIKQYAA